METEFVSNEARHRDIAALLARGVIRVKRSPLAAKAIESLMPNSKAYSAEQSTQGDQSANFSRGLSEFLDAVLANTVAIALWEKQWLK